MKILSNGTVFVLTIALLCVSTVYSEPLSGNIGASAQWGSGWLDLSTMTDFQQGETLRIRVGGNARKIVVRFLTKGIDPNIPSGIDGGIVEVPESGIVEKVLQENHRNVVQISVHGGTNPWGFFSLGGGNGPATLLSAERIARVRGR